MFAVSRVSMLNGHACIMSVHLLEQQQCVQLNLMTIKMEWLKC